MSLTIAAHNGARSYGGGEKWTVLLLRGLRDRGHRVHLFCNGPEVLERARAAGVEASRWLLGGHLMLPHVVRFGQQLRRYRPDVLLLTTFKKVWLGGMAARLARVPRVVSRVGLDSDLPAKHWSYRVAYRRWVDVVLVNADGIRRDFLAGLPDYEPGRVATVYDGIELEPSGLSSDVAREGLGVPRGAPVVGSVTRLSDQKRLDRMLDAVALLPDVHLVLAGEGELEEELRGRAADQDIAHRVHFVGYRSDVAAVLAALDVFVITSDREGMANAMLESLTAGVPVVSTPVSGASEALAPDAEGRAAGVIVPKRPADIAEALRRILDDPEARRTMGEEGRRRARARFSYATMLDAWEAVLGGAHPGAWHAGPGESLPTGSR